MTVAPYWTVTPRLLRHWISNETRDLANAVCPQQRSYAITNRAKLYRRLKAAKG